MSELKTFKDLTCWEDMKKAQSPLEKEFHRGAVQLKHDLRQEAIKWLKELKQSPDEPLVSVKKNDIQEYTRMVSLNIQVAENQSLIMWIKHFFNITEEDLE